mmetsp:Transcript_22327/g.68882  ORF Transcript_22327/g.68882 Transcript_22327/m.68882 type:complete len:203 (-) Transcript_22327:337-945(-)
MRSSPAPCTLAAPRCRRTRLGRSRRRTRTAACFLPARRSLPGRTASRRSRPTGSWAARRRRRRAPWRCCPPRRRHATSSGRTPARATCSSSAATSSSRAPSSPSPSLSLSPRRTAWTAWRPRTCSRRPSLTASSIRATASAFPSATTRPAVSRSSSAPRTSTSCSTRPRRRRCPCPSAPCCATASSPPRPAAARTSTGAPSG